MPRSQEIAGRKVQSQGKKKHPTSSSNSSSSSKGKRKKQPSVKEDKGKVKSEDRWDDERKYTSSESSGLSTTSTIIMNEKESSLRNKEPIDCMHKAIGCSKYFYSYVDRNRHSKDCIFGFFKTCQERTCENQAFLGTFADYVEHAHTDHSVPLITVSKSNEPLTIPMQCSEAFLRPSERAYSSKVLVGLQQKTESETFNLALYAVVKALTYGSPVISVVPAVYAHNKQVYHFVRLKLTLQLAQNNEEKNFTVFRGMRHPSHLLNAGYQVLVPAFNCPAQLMSAMQTCRTISYAINDARQANQMLATVEFCRVKMKHEKKVKLQPYFLTWEESRLQRKSQNMLPDAQNENPDPITAVLLPQLNERQNILLEFIDDSHVLKLLIAKIHQEIHDEGVKEGPRNSKLLILYPDELTLSHDGKIMKTFVVGAGISAFLIPPMNSYPMDNFEKCGTSVVISTPDALREFLNKRPRTLENIVFSKLQYVVLPFADHASRNKNAAVVGDILAKIPEQERKGIGRLAITPYMSRNLVHVLRQNFFGNEYKLLSMGESPASQIRGMRVIDVLAETPEKKIAEVIKITTTGKVVRDGKWLVLANDLDPGYDTNYEKLLAKLQESYDAKCLSMVSTMDEAVSNPNAFDSFQLEQKAVLLSSYFFIQFSEIVKLCDSIIIFTLPPSKSILARLTKIARNEEGNLKPIFNLRDSLSPNKITADYFMD